MKKQGRPRKKEGGDGEGKKEGKEGGGEKEKKGEKNEGDEGDKGTPKKKRAREEKGEGEGKEGESPGKKSRRHTKPLLSLEVGVVLLLWFVLCAYGAAVAYCQACVGARK